MPQTLLGLLGIVLVSLLSLQQLRAGIDTDDKLRIAEVQTVAAGTATGHLNRLESLPFDEAVKDAYITSAAELTPIIGSGFYRPGGDAADDDLDDVHGTTSVSSHAFREGQTDLQLRTSFVVEYVSETDAEAASAVSTRFKRVTVTVTSADVPEADVTLSQVYSCGSYCDW